MRPAESKPVGTERAMNIKILSLSAALLAAIAVTGCNKGGGGEIAKVNGMAITNADLIEYLEAKPTVRVSIQGQTQELPVADTLGFQAMQDLVVRKLILQLAKEEGVLPDGKAVEEEINLRKEVNTGYVKVLQQRGMTMSGIRQQIEVELAQQNLIAKGITVTDKEVEDYIKENPRQFTEPAKVEMFWIVTDGAGRAAVDSAITSGKKFQDVAKEFSKDPAAKVSDGKFQAQAYPTGFPLDNLPPEIKGPVEKVAIGKPTDWIAMPNTPGVFAKFYVTRRTEARPIEMTDARKKLVKRGLAVSRGAETKDLQERIANRLREAKITVSDSNLKALWEQFEKALKANADKAQMPTTTEGAGTN